ncbi:IS1182 family transposase [Oceanobacillus sp. CF4.6]|uniref:IS1182 family transposase n=1 Tax=Oceanobacillus sp. CF4.6 TaxID=3373080 RepID=UPI003EE73B21
MLVNQESLMLSAYANLYDMVVPKDNMLRRMNELVNFSFVVEELKEKYCLDNGRNAVPPIRMFKYVLLKVIYDISDVDVVERSKYDMSFKYFLGYAPEDPVIHPSSLTKFRRMRLKDKDLLDLLINKSVEIALEQEVIESKTIIVDATHTASRYCAKPGKEFLREKSKQLRKAIYQFDESIKEELPEKPTTDESEAEFSYCEKLVETIEDRPELTKIPAVNERMNVLKEVMDDYDEHRSYSEDPEARKGHKSRDYSFHGYKTHLAMSDERIITGAVITSGEKGDGQYLEELVGKSEAAGMEVDTVIGDTAYSGKTNLNHAKGKYNLISKLHPVITNGTRKNEDHFKFNKDADLYVCPAGHLAKRKHTFKRKNGRSDQIRYYYDVEICKTCPLREGCYKEGAKTKSYSVTLLSTEHAEHEAYQETDEFRELARNRYKIEAKNGELKNRHGYKQAKSSGLFGMQIQGATTIFAVNIKRIMKLMDVKE